MTVAETIAGIVRFTRSTAPQTQGEWLIGGQPGIWVDEDDASRLCIARCDWTRAHDSDAWAAHPALLAFPHWKPGQLDSTPEIALASWVLDVGALDAVIVAGVDANYARVAHRAGFTDAWAIIEAWDAGIPVEYLAAMS